MELRFPGAATYVRANGSSPTEQSVSTGMFAWKPLTLGWLPCIQAPFYSQWKLSDLMYPGQNAVLGGGPEYENAGAWQTSGNDIKITAREQGTKRETTESKVLHGFWDL